MTIKELTQKTLEQAINEAQVYFRNIPKLTPTFIQGRIIDCIHRQFVNQSIPLTQFELKQLNKQTYSINVNRSAFFTIDIKKEVHDE